VVIIRVEGTRRGGVLTPAFMRKVNAMINAPGYYKPAKPQTSHTHRGSVVSTIQKQKNRHTSLSMDQFNQIGDSSRKYEIDRRSEDPEVRKAAFRNHTRRVENIKNQQPPRFLSRVSSYFFKK
jgi:hypothetical protein